DASGAAEGSSGSLRLGTPSGQLSPAPSFEGDRTKRARVEDLDDTSQEHPKIIDVEDPSNSLSSSLH
ncbi:hypothetical protein A2U01_0119224, partial [Trifolium medium]|nr:hypothetical protein [Trifolium medium]